MIFNMRATSDPAGQDRTGQEAARTGERDVSGFGANAHAMSSAPTDAPGAGCLDAHHLEEVFADCFAAAYSTQLEGGGDEPLYIASPDPSRTPHRIVYREDYFSSALHEIAHWCLAGADRRRHDDYGYWYQPDGRSREQQSEFEAVEARPQALESILSDACGHAFHLSADNLAGGTGPSEHFAAAVARERRQLEAAGLPPRAARFHDALHRAFGAGSTPASDPR